MNQASRILTVDPPVAIYAVCTGAGAGLQKMLWEPPGASAYLVGAHFPYRRSQTDEFLGFEPDSYCSEKNALQLAMEAYARARGALLREGLSQTPVGVAVSASVATLRMHQGDHRVHVAFVTPTSSVVTTAILHKGEGPVDRAEDGEISDYLGLSTALRACGLLLTEDIPFRAQARAAGWNSRIVEQPELMDIFFEHPYLDGDGLRHSEEWLRGTVDGEDADTGADADALCFYPGSFNPLHEGHRNIYEELRGENGGENPIYMVTADRPHKPPLRAQELLDRLAMFRKEKWEYNGPEVLFTRGDPLFINKARNWPGHNFGLGADALATMVDPKWGVDPEALMQEFEDLQTEFYVFGRKVGDRHYSATEAVDEFVPDGWRHLFTEVEFEQPDISSTEIRERAGR